MPSPTIYAANRLTHILNTYSFPRHPIRWNVAGKRWEKDPSKFRVFLFYVINFCVVGIIVNALLLHLHLRYLCDPSLFKAHHLVIQVMITACVQVHVLVTLTTFLFMDDLVAVLNNLYNLDEESGLSSFQGYRDTTGVTFCAMSLLGTIFAVIMWNGLAVINMDLLYLTFLGMGWPMQELATPSMIVLRQVLAFLHIQMAAATLRTFVILLLSVDVWLAKLVQLIMATARQNNAFGLATNVELYRKIHIVVRAMWSFGVFMGESGLSFTFIIIVNGVGAAFVAFIEGNYLLSFLSITAIIPSFVVLQLVFSTLCSVFENSQVILERWKERAAWIKDAGYMKRLVRSLHVLALPAGNMGIMDRQIKVNYHDALLNWIVTILMIFSDMMSNQ